MKYHILLPLTIEADPADFTEAARKGFVEIAEQFNTGRPMKIKLLMQDGSEEALLLQHILNCCIGAETPVSFIP